MMRGANLPLAMLVGALVVVGGVGSTLPAQPPPYSLTLQELMRSIIINQMAILDGMNEFTSSGYGDEVNQLQQYLEEWQAMNETMVEGINVMNDMNYALLTEINALSQTMEKEIQMLKDTRETRTREINELHNKTEILDARVQRRMEELEEELANKQDVINEINEKLEAVQTTVTGHHEVMEAWQAMNDTMVEGMDDMNYTLLTEVNQMDTEYQAMHMIEEMDEEIDEVNNTIQSGLAETRESIERAMDEMNDKIQFMERNIEKEMRDLGEKMETKINNKIQAINKTLLIGMEEINRNSMNDIQGVMQKLEAVQTSVAAHHYRPDPDDLYADHNDTFYSLCDGHKVLHGGDGILMVTSRGNYDNNMDCSWTVTLPEGSRPVFWWSYFDLQDCSPCSKCDYVYITDPDHSRVYRSCGKAPFKGNFLMVMNNKFVVKFHSDGGVTGRGFKLQYRAVEKN